MSDQKFYRVGMLTRDQQLKKGQKDSNEAYWLCPETGIVVKKSPYPGEEIIFHISNIPGSDWWVVPFEGKRETKTFEELLKR